MEPEQKRYSVEGLEALVKALDDIGHRLHLRGREEGKLPRWNGDVILTSRPGLIYFAHYPASASSPHSRKFEESLLFRIKDGRVGNLHSLMRLPFSFYIFYSVGERVADKLRADFYAQEDEWEMETFPLSVGEATFRVYSAGLGDKFKKTLRRNLGTVAMRLYGMHMGRERVGAAPEGITTAEVQPPA